MIYVEGKAAVFNRSVALAGYYLMAFLFGGNPVIVSWMIANTAGQTKKSVTSKYSPTTHPSLFAADKDSGLLQRRQCRRKHRWTPPLPGQGQTILHTRCPSGPHHLHRPRWTCWYPGRSTLPLQQAAREATSRCWQAQEDPRYVDGSQIPSLWTRRERNGCRCSW